MHSLSARRTRVGVVQYITITELYSVTVQAFLSFLDGLILTCTLYVLGIIN